MTIWDELERRIHARGVRIEERLRLLKVLHREFEAGGDPAEALGNARDELLSAIQREAAALRKEALG